ncbi:MAG: amino acid ABC transporter permease [Geothrix sp.]|nr:amino acid ABC transporter permease [Geothrix sp.]
MTVPAAGRTKGLPSADPASAMRLNESSLIPGDRETLAAWKLAFFGAIALLVALPLLRPHPFLEILAFVPDGLTATFTVTLASIGLALVLGLLAGLGRIARTPVLNRIATVYVEVVRGIPLLVQLFYIYYALGPLLHLNGLMAAIAALSICYGAYLAEIFRAGIQSIPKGQMEAALALGLSRTQALGRIILPQTIRVILPPIGNEFIALLKDSSLVSILAVSDLLRRGREYASTTFDYLEAYTVVALIYLILTLFFSRLVGLLEERMRTHGRQHH